ncbi:MAG: hypothetical protein R6X34_28065 [Chloroflexota bacterium]
MENLKTKLAVLPSHMVGSSRYLSYQAVTDTVAAFLFPHSSTDQMDAAAYQRVLETADTLCRQLGYQEVVKLTPPDVDFSAMGLYWSAAPQADTDPAPIVIHAGPGPVEMLADGLLLDARLSHPSTLLWTRLGLDEVTRQHFKIPVTASDGVIDLMQRAVASDWPNDFKGLWHDILGMCIAAGEDVSPTRRQFTVIIRGVGQRRYWRFMAEVQSDNSGAPFLYICLITEAQQPQTGLFPLGQIVMTPGVAALGIDVTAYIARHESGDWGGLDNFDKRQNETAVKEGLRILSAYDVPTGDGERARLWVITEADRSVTTALLPEEY